MPDTTLPINAIIGLGNPGAEYANTRHNAGVWFLEKLAQHHQVSFRPEKKFKGLHASFRSHEQICHLFIPQTFMNHSGQAVHALAQFYQLSPENLLVVHDELDLIPGDIRLKFGGGHGGHNGLRDIIHHLHTPGFYRMRIGIGHPGVRELVTPFVLDRPSHAEQIKIDRAIDTAQSVVPLLLAGEFAKAMQQLHTITHQVN